MSVSKVWSWYADILKTAPSDCVVKYKLPTEESLLKPYVEKIPVIVTHLPTSKN